MATDENEDPDFLLPACDFERVFIPLTPMSYAGALFFVRHFIHCPWKSQSSPLKGLDLSFTVHSLKATLLSWGPQLHSVVSRELRLAQDHHKEPNDSLNAYGRDSVWGSLHYQRILIDQVRSGFRPQIPQHRGAQQPLVEPAVTLEFFRKDLPSVQWRWFRGFSSVGPGGHSTRRGGRQLIFERLLIRFGRGPVRCFGEGARCHGV